MYANPSPRRALAVAILTLPLTFASLPVAAAEAEKTPSELAREGMERMLRAIELMIEMIPQYEMPEVLENGDIIIRRKRPDPSEEPDPGREPGDNEDSDQTRT